MRRGLDYTINLSNGSFGAVMQSSRQQARALAAELRRLQNEFSASRAAGKAAGGGGSKGFGVGDFIKGDLIASGIKEGIGMVKNFIADVPKTTARIQGYTNAIKFASGSTVEGAKNIDFLRQNSDKLGTSLESSFKGFKQFSGAMIGSKFGGETVRRMFDDVQVSSAAMNLTAEDSEGVYLALGQIMSKGKVQAEELRGQIGERIPGAFQIAARAMGMTTQQLDKVMSKGGLMAEDFLPKFTAELRKTFQGALPEATNSMQAGFNRMDNAALNLKTTMGDAFTPAINEGTQALTSFFNATARAIAGQTPMTDKIRESKVELNAEFEVLRKSWISLDERKTLIAKINEQASPYLKNLLTEQSTLEEIAKAQRMLNEEMDKKIAIQAKNEIMADYTKEIVDMQKDIFSLKIDEAKFGNKDAKDYYWFTSNEGVYDAKKTARGFKEKELTQKMSEMDEARNALDNQLESFGMDKGGHEKIEDKHAVFNSKKETKTGGGGGSDLTSTSAGRSVRNVTVHINKLVESMYIQNESENLKDNRKARGQVNELLIRAIADFEQAQD